MKDDINFDSWSSWTLKKLESFKSRRDCTSKATFKVINDTMNTIINGNKGLFDKNFMVLEIGSGTGFAIGLFFQYNTNNDLPERWIQSEPNPELASENECNYGKQVIVSSIQALPGILNGRSFPLVFAVNWLDTQIGSADTNLLESAVDSLLRIIPPKGYFVHFMDLNPSYDVVVAMCKSYPLAYPLPFHSRDMHIGVQFISRKDIQKLANEKTGEPGIEDLKLYLDDPLNSYLKLVSGNSLAFNQLANLIYRLVETYHLDVHKQTTFIQYFEDVAKLAFKPKDWLVTMKAISDEVITDLEERHKKGKEIVATSGNSQGIINNTIINVFGFAMGRTNDERVPHGKIREISHMHILTARKKYRE